jgi:hypothetical protein
MDMFEPPGLQTNVAEVSTTVNESETGRSAAKGCGQDDDDRKLLGTSTSYKKTPGWCRGHKSTPNEISNLFHQTLNDVLTVAKISHHLTFSISWKIFFYSKWQKR